MAVGILTDSHSGLSHAEAEKLGIGVLPMPFLIDGECFLEDVTLSRKEFFARQAAGAEIATSQPAPADVLALWDWALGKYDQVLYMPISSGLSGSYATAEVLAQDDPYTGRVFVVDHGRVATPLHQMLLDTVELVRQGYGAEEIKAILERCRDDMVIYLAVQDLEYLKRGGRVTPGVAAVGTLLHIKPVLKLATGKLDSYKKCRGFSRAKETMLEAIRADLTIRFREAHARGDVSLLAASSGTPEETAQWVKEISAAFPGMPILCDDLSLGVCCHTGPGALGIGLSCRPRAQVD